MRRMSGTITLSYMEEDNKQRVIFRVVPLCTREGITFRDVEEAFPDHGSLRIVPDKREQSTFKERMREMGKLCVIELLLSDGKEMAKVRKNKNYSPSQGEYNQYAIYSDIIQEFAPDGIFEVIEWSQRLEPPSELLTQTVLLLSDKVLYGPVAPEEIGSIILSELTPFGNDQFLLHTIELPDQTAHTLYWNPEATLNWRQRRSSLRRKTEKAHSAKTDLSIVSEQAIGRDEFSVERDEIIQMTESLDNKEALSVELTLRQQPARNLKDDISAGDLPIGTKLEILDASLPFEQQLSRLEQPLPINANRLADESAKKASGQTMASVRFAGTPFVRDVAHMPKSIGRPEPLHHVVDQQMRLSREERMGAEIQGSFSKRIENPVENLIMAVDAAWQDKETREQAISVLLENQSFTDAMLEALRVNGHEIHAVAAANAQLEDIEAERLSVLMQLEHAKENRKRYQEQTIASVSELQQQEIAKLAQEIRVLSQEKEKLEKTLVPLSENATKCMADKLWEQLTGIGGIEGNRRTLISPVVGKHRDVQDMLDALCHRLSSYGFAMCEDDAMLLLVGFALFPSFCLQAQRLEDAQLFATGFLEALGLQNVSAMVGDGGTVRIASLLADNELRTPTVTIQRLGTGMLSVFGHKTIFLAQEMDQPLSQNEMPVLFPVIRVPKMVKSTLEFSHSLPLAEPAALSSFGDLTAEIHPLLEEAEAWFKELANRCDLATMPISDALLLGMRKFVAVSSRKLRGGFLAAADAAVCHWMVPLILQKPMCIAEMSSVLSGLPRALDALGIR